MYEPIRNPSVHTMAETDVPHRSRDEELDIRLAGHLTALLTVTDELRALTPSPDLDEAGQLLAAQSARLGGGRAPLRAAPSARSASPSHVTALHQRAHNLAGMALVIATSREDEAAAALAAERLEIHAAALGLTASA
ncbi:hypothetical protein DVA86_14825 [Streptomyces armeniacus]|uniref:Uncharacterized protein n=1 Tax=Streptomyces armeniacus TaxID=83291 RepID=A0A345XQ23_9ACTN|nr:hypothetical protein [Streptomyces armeniacus]AXK33739.1 hypothetical protein DVA86_14825 [Streptomyces armeniacus]